jgi:hypothetical protein
MVMATTTDQFTEGQRVNVTQQIPLVRGVWSTQVEGDVVRYEQRKTGSWYAHARDDKLWLDRLTLRKDDGEIVTLNLDSYTHVEAIDKPQPEPAPEVEAEADVETETEDAEKAE